MSRKPQIAMMKQQQSSPSPARRMIEIVLDGQVYSIPPMSAWHGEQLQELFGDDCLTSPERLANPTFKFISTLVTLMVDDAGGIIPEEITEPEMKRRWVAKRLDLRAIAEFSRSLGDRTDLDRSGGPSPGEAAGPGK